MQFYQKIEGFCRKMRPKKNPVPFHCANHSEKPLKAKIIFSRGFNDF